jgi:hypothetical protein
LRHFAFDNVPAKFGAGKIGATTMGAVALATILIRVFGVVSLAFGCLCLALFLVAIILLGGPLKSYDVLTDGVITWLAGRGILCFVFGLCLILPSRRLARFAAKLTHDQIISGNGAGATAAQQETSR